jgi:aspartyl-tRNA(Asn)/glutamyl-tRNA(Gln) amidotransferase subunit A
VSSADVSILHETMMAAGPLLPATAAGIALALREKRLSAREVATWHLERIARLDPALHALVLVDGERALAAASRADARLARGDPSPLLGVPFVVKDNIWVRGCRITQGSRLFRDFVAPESALPVRRMEEAGAVLLGIGACPEFACKGSTDSPLHGATRNPWDLGRTPGGSSGGPAAAVAARLAPLALATDAGGSIRRPAAHTGIVGLKPSRGRVPQGPGFAEAVFGNGVVGPMTRSVADAAMMLEVLVRFDALDADVVPLRLTAWRAVDPGSLRIACSPRLGLDVPVDSEVAAAVAGTVEKLRATGLEIADADPAWPADTSEGSVMPLQEVGLAALYGERFRSDPELFDPAIGAQIERGLGHDGPTIGRALLARERIANAVAAFFADYDLLLCPTVPCVPWPLGQPGPATIDGRGHAVFTPLLNHAGVPACSVPCGLVDGLPVGLQIIGRRFADALVLALALRLEASLEAPLVPPAPFGG